MKTKRQTKMLELIKKHDIETQEEFGLKNEDSMVVADIYCPLALMEA